MTTIATGDLHWSANPRDAYRHDWVKDELIPLIRKRKADRVVLLGDYTDQKDNHGAWLTNKITGHFIALSKVCDVYALQGNHDGLSPSNPFFEFVGKYPNIHWIKESTPVTFDDLGKCMFVPFVRKPADWDDILAEGKWDWIFAHATFKGAVLENGEKADGISPVIFDRQRVVSGDVHVPQQVGPITYVGAPYPIKFGDSYKPRVLILNDRTGLNTETVLCRGPRKLVIDIGRLRDLEDHPDIDSKDIIKVRFSVEAASYAKWPQLRQEVVKWADREGVTLDSVTPVPLFDEKPKAKAKAATDHHRSDKDVMQTYCERFQVDKETLDVGFSIMGRV